MPFQTKIAPGPYKEHMRLAKFTDDQNPETDEPYEIIERVFWYDEYNNPIDDPIRIAELEEIAARQLQGDTYAIGKSGD